MPSKKASNTKQNQRQMRGNLTTKDYKKAAKKLREIAILETKPCYALSPDEVAKIEKRNAYAAIVKTYTKMTLSDLPPDVINIILSYLPHYARLILLRHRYPSHLLTNKIRNSTLNIFTMMDYIRQVRPLIDTFLNKNDNINTFMQHFCYYARHIRTGGKNQDIIAYTFSSGKQILSEIVTNYVKMYRYAELKNKHVLFERIVFKLFSDILLS